jgi:hypothetical protein
VQQPATSPAFATSAVRPQGEEGPFVTERPQGRGVGTIHGEVMSTPGRDRDPRTDLSTRIPRDDTHGARKTASCSTARSRRQTRCIFDLLTLAVADDSSGPAQVTACVSYLGPSIMIDAMKASTCLRKDGSPFDSRIMIWVTSEGAFGLQ